LLWSKDYGETDELRSSLFAHGKCVAVVSPEAINVVSIRNKLNFAIPVYA
jgi:hypothetical protein